MKLISVRDLKAEAYLQPICVRTTAEAIRLFENQCKNKETSFSQNPEDYVLFELADYNELTGAITPLLSPHPIANASQFAH